jgi:uncharacterized protein (DUF3084 family)
VSSENTLGAEIQRIRDRLRAMRSEREAAMHELTASREHAEAQRQGRSPAPPEPPSNLPSTYAP